MLNKALKDMPQGLEFLPMNTVVVDGARINFKRHAYLKFHCPDGWVKNLRGNPKLSDLYITARVPREWVDAVRALMAVEEKLKSENAEPQPSS